MAASISDETRASISPFVDVVQHAGLAQRVFEALDRVALAPPDLDLFTRAVAAVVVVAGVGGRAVGLRLDQGRALAALARSSASRVTRQQATTSLPSTITPGMLYAFAFRARSATALCFESGTEMAYSLFSQMKITGNLWIAGPVQPLVEIALAGGPVAEVGDGDVARAANLGRQGRAGGVRESASRSRWRW